MWRPAIGRFDLRGAEGGVFRSIVMGESDQLPFVGDWNGDGRADVGVYDRDTRTFTLRTPRGKFRSFVHGPAGGLPIAGDWDGDGQDELGTWDPATGAFDLRATDPPDPRPTDLRGRWPDPSGAGHRPWGTSARTGSRAPRPRAVASRRPPCRAGRSAS